MSSTGLTRGRSALRDLVWFWLPPLAWMGMIFYLSAQPDLPGPPESWLNAWLIDKLLKKGAHFGVYAGLAFWWWRALRRPQTLSEAKETGKIALLLAFGVSVLYAVSDEFHQSFVPGREPRLLDVLIDATGAATALGLMWRWRVGSQ